MKSIRHISKMGTALILILAVLPVFHIVICRPRNLIIPEDYEVKFEIGDSFSEHIPQNELSGDLLSFLSEIKITRVLESPLKGPLPVDELRYIWIYRKNDERTIGYIGFKLSDPHSMVFVDYDNKGSSFTKYRVHSNIGVEELNRIIVSNSME